MTEHEDMSERGATRPSMTHDDRLARLEQHHRRTLWVYWALLILGLWTLLSPLTFAYDLGVVAPSGGRSVWLSLEARINAMIWSDIVSGAVLLIFAWRSLTPNRPVSLWICCFVGIWLSFAPLLFWAPTAVAYLNSTIVGALVIALTVIIPGMPNMIMYMKMGPATPPGWSYNPSSWAQRSILIALGLLGWLVSRHLAAYQLGYLDRVWEPLFGRGSVLVLDSDVSHSFPISDAGLGSLAYTIEFLMAWMGSPARWRTMPWMVTLFGILVIPLGLVHIILVISQPLAVGHWCSLCLVAAALMLPMIPLEVDEVIAMIQHLRRSKRGGTSVWDAFWRGGPAQDSTPDERSPAIETLSQQPKALLAASLWGASVPWTLALSALLGLWMMLAPAVFGSSSTASDLAQLGGALVVVVAVLALGEPIRALRYLNLPLGLTLIIAPWLVEGATGPGAINATLVGVLLLILSLPRGPKRERYAGWDRFVV
jgi:hypothetical protein